MPITPPHLTIRDEVIGPLFLEYIGLRHETGLIEDLLHGSAGEAPDSATMIEVFRAAIDKTLRDGKSEDAEGLIGSFRELTNLPDSGLHRDYERFMARFRTIENRVIGYELIHRALPERVAFAVDVGAGQNNLLVEMARQMTAERFAEGCGTDLFDWRGVESASDPRVGVIHDPVLSSDSVKS